MEAKAKINVENVITHFGVSYLIHLDQGSQYKRLFIVYSYVKTHNSEVGIMIVKELLPFSLFL